MTLKVLFASAEALPFSKTGGLADVAGALPAALAARGVEVRLVTPAYRGVLGRTDAAEVRAALTVRGQRFVIQEAPGAVPGVRTWLVDYPPLYGREGSPYADPQHRPFADNAWRFGCFAETVARLALDTSGLGWRADVVHCNDWHTGLTALGLASAPRRPRTVFSIHNLAYQGRFGRTEFDALGLPAEHWHPGALEFHGGFSFLKAGLVFSDALTTVSPTYAREIQTPAAGHGLDGVLRERAAQMRGIANGIDERAWDPATDPHLARRYDGQTFVEGKRANRDALRAELGLAPGAAPLVAFIGRLAHQKGADLLLEAADDFHAAGVQVALLGTGDRALEDALAAWARRRPGEVAVRIGHDEALAHRLEAGADIFLMPSRYEPCGLNQMYSQRYGTVPVARRTGGLADTITEATPATLAAGTATGVLFDDADRHGIAWGLRRALELMGQPETWRALQRAGMRRDFGWARAAREYLALYAALRQA